MSTMSTVWVADRTYYCPPNVRPASCRCRLPVVAVDAAARRYYAHDWHESDMVVIEHVDSGVTEVYLHRLCGCADVDGVVDALNSAYRGSFRALGLARRVEVSTWSWMQVLWLCDGVEFEAAVARLRQGCYRDLPGWSRAVTAMADALGVCRP